MLKGEFLFSILIFLISAGLYLVTGSFKGHELYGKLGPAYWPRFIIYCLLVLSAMVFLKTFYQLRKQQAWSDPLIKIDEGKLRIFATIVLIASYLSILNIFGFIITTPFFLIILMRLLGEKINGWSLCISVAMTSIIVFLFTKAMYVPIPRGTGIFRKFTILFY